MRKPPSEEAETDILFNSRRRCALCFGLFSDLSPKRGQIAHVDRDSSNSEYENLCFLCLPHHDEYDSKTSQSKRFTPSELARHREALYTYIRSGQALTETTVAKRPEDRPFFSLNGNSISASGLELRLRNDGAPVTCLDFHSANAACHVRNWHPRSLPNGELLRASVTLIEDRDRPQCAFRMRVRDRSDAERVFQLTLDFAQSPPGFDVLEVA